MAIETNRRKMRLNESGIKLFLFEMSLLISECQFSHFLILVNFRGPKITEKYTDPKCKRNKKRETDLT